MTCKNYSQRVDVFEDYLDGRLEADAAATVTAHLEQCAACREEVESARLAGVLLRVALEPTAVPDELFWIRLRRTLRLRAGEEEESLRSAPFDLAQGRQDDKRDFWPALELLARRLTLTSAVALVLLFAFLFATERTEPAITASSQTEVREIFPESVRQPANQNEVLVSLAANGNGR